MTEDEMIGWHHWLDGHEFKSALGVGDGQGSLAWYSLWGCKDSDTIELLKWTDFSISTIQQNYFQALGYTVLDSPTRTGWGFVDLWGEGEYGYGTKSEPTARWGKKHENWQSQKIRGSGIRRTVHSGTSVIRMKWYYQNMSLPFSQLTYVWTQFKNCP